MYLLRFWEVNSKLRFNPEITSRKNNGFITEETDEMLHAKQGKQKHDVHQHVRN